jgi:phosphohistidine swiveling domain-containing protein
LAGLIAACKGVIVESFKPCVEVALKKAEALIAKEIGITADAATKK